MPIKDINSLILGIRLILLRALVAKNWMDPEIKVHPKYKSIANHSEFS